MLLMARCRGNEYDDLEMANGHEYIVGYHAMYRTTQCLPSQNSLARAVVKAPKFTHTTPILKSLHWLKINERIQYKIIYLTFKLLYTTQPPYLYDLISLQTPRNTRSSSVVTLARPPTRSLLKITGRSFRYASPYLWNQLHHSLRQPHLDLPLPDSSLLQDHLTSPVSSSPLLSSITPSFFHSKLKTILFLKSYPT